MAVHSCLPDRRLFREVAYYALGENRAGPFYAYEFDAILFNLGGARLAIDGALRKDPCLFTTGCVRAMLVETGEGDVLVAKLCRGGLYRLFSIDSSRHYGEIITADERGYPTLATIDRAVRQAKPDLATRIAALDEALIPFATAARPYGPAERFRFLVQRARGRVRVAEAADELGVSVRTLERECRRRLGRTPAHIIRALRYQMAVREQLDTGIPSWQNIPPDIPYADQSHFLRDARDIMGMPPRRFFSPSERKSEWHRYPRGDISAAGASDKERTDRDWREMDEFFRLGDLC